MYSSNTHAKCLQLLLRVGAVLHDMNDPGCVTAFSLARAVTPGGSVMPYGSTWQSAAAECTSAANALHKEHWSYGDLDHKEQPVPDYTLVSAWYAAAMAHACSALAVVSERWMWNRMKGSETWSLSATDPIESLYAMARAYEQRADELAEGLESAAAEARAAERKAEQATAAKPSKKRKGGKR